MNIIVVSCWLPHDSQYLRMCMSPPTFPRFPPPAIDITKQIHVHTHSCLPRIHSSKQTCHSCSRFSFSFSFQLVSLFLLAQFPFCLAPLPHTIDNYKYHFHSDSNNTYSFSNKLHQLQQHQPHTIGAACQSPCHLLGTRLMLVLPLEGIVIGLLSLVHSNARNSSEFAIYVLVIHLCTNTIN